MRTKLPSRFEPSSRFRGYAQLERHTRTYREYLLDRGNAAGYVRSCEAAVVHLSMWMKQTNKRLADVGEGLVTEFLKGHLPVCRCATSARHPITVRAALGHLLVVLRAADAIAPEPQDTTAVGQELSRYAQYMEQVRSNGVRSCYAAPLSSLAGFMLLASRIGRQLSDGQDGYGARTPPSPMTPRGSRGSDYPASRAIPPAAVRRSCTLSRSFSHLVVCSSPSRRG